MAYIIGTYNKYDMWDRSHAREKFTINEQWYAIFEVEMEWGIPKLEVRTDRNQCAHEYKIYERLEDAKKFVREIKRFNAR